MKNKLLAGLTLLILMGCNPTVRVEPIKIEIEATIKIQIEKEVEELLEDDDLF